MSIDWNSIGVRSASGPGAAAPATTTTGSSQLGQSDFLTLLTTQLKNQDPLSPLDNAAFVAQLAQFSTVSGITEMNASLKSMAAAAADQHASAPQWIGRAVADAAGEAGLVASVSFAGDGSLLLNLDSGVQMPAASVARLA
jgi:flagellar basal-body rod modification protein FlgD